MLKIKYSFPILLIITYIILACISLNSPGLHYDEVLFGNAALGGIDNSFIYKKIYGFPVMLMPYIGALKAYIYFPVFLIFDPSYISIRLPMIILASVSLWIIYVYTSKTTNITVAILSLLFLVADSSFISLTRTDVGPVVIGLFFRSLALLYFFKYIEDKQSKYLIFIAISLILGLYDKLNFIWFINSFIVASIIFFPDSLVSIKNLFRTKVAKMFIVIFAVIFISLIILIFQLGITKELTLIPSQGHFNNIYNNLFHLTNGTAYYEMVFGEWTGTRILGWTIWSVIIIGSVLNFFQPKSKIKTFHSFNLLIFFLILLQILLTKQATAPWHVFMLQPTMAHLLAPTLIIIINAVSEQNKKLNLIIITTLSLLIFGSQAFIYSSYIARLEKPYRAFIWTKKIDELFIYSQSVPNRIVSMDWGIHTQLLTLGKQSGKYYELFFDQNDFPKAERLKQLESDYFNPDKRYLFLFHSESKTLSKSTRQYFFEIAQTLDLKPELIKTVDENRETLYEVYQLKPK